jgi:hypothetical protein
MAPRATLVNDERALRICLTALSIAQALACTACDALVGLDPPQSDAAPDAMTQGASDAGACGDGAIVCARGCADIASDGLNCGACGHSCLGAGCDGGQCLPVVLATAYSPRLALDVSNGPGSTGDGFVYWSDETHGAVMRCPASGCSDGGETLFAETSTFLPGTGLSVGGLAVVGGQVFFAEDSPDGGEVYSCPTSGCGGAPKTIAVEPGLAVEVVADTQYVYWYSVQDLAVHFCPLRGCNGSPTVLEQGGVYGHLAASNGTVYFAPPSGLGGGGIIACTGPAADAGEDGGMGWQCNGGFDVASGALPVSVGGIAVGGPGVYWTVPSLSEVAAFPVAMPSSGAVLATVQLPEPSFIAADSDSVYFNSGKNNAAASLYKCPAANCAQPSFVAPGPVGGIAVDAQRIYTIMPAPLPPDASAETFVSSSIVWVAK